MSENIIQYECQEIIEKPHTLKCYVYTENPPKGYIITVDQKFGDMVYLFTKTMKAVNQLLPNNNLSKHDKFKQQYKRKNKFIK